MPSPGPPTGRRRRHRARYGPRRGVQQRLHDQQIHCITEILSPNGGCISMDLSRYSMFFPSCFSCFLS